MSKRPNCPLLGTLVIVIAAATGTAFASTSPLDAVIAEVIQPSAVPALLGPIAETGRSNWTCRPEKAASARYADVAQLPGAETNR